jgi:hypothetical protein
MHRLCLALAVGVLLLLFAGVGTATAAPPVIQDSGGQQDAGQEVGSSQDAGAAAGTAQQEPTNDNSAVRVLSPGDEGSVSQTNEATSDATAENQNSTDQSADQTQAGGSGLQAIGQSAENEQDAIAVGLTAQTGASNVNAPVRVLSPDEAVNGKHEDGKAEEAKAAPAPSDEGSVEQTNTASSDADAFNENSTDQTADQTQASGQPNDLTHAKDPCKCEGGGEQLIGQSAENDQKAAAVAATVQEKPSNQNISVRVLSPGDNGPVTQTNEATSDADASNSNETDQTATQEQSGDSCKCGSGGEQLIGQEAKSDQKAVALAGTIQEKPSNTNISVRVLSPGDDGPVTQTNTATSDADAENVNETTQTADQSQAGSGGLQEIGQSAKNDQKSLAGALTVQKDASNKNISVRVLSPGENGKVEQTNKASSDADAFNQNETDQTATQEQSGDSCKCKGAGEQLIGQKADSEQEAKAISATFQVKPSNENLSARVLSKGDDGSVEQTNKATSEADAENLNFTDQSADQTQGSGGLQAIGQSAKNDQDAFALGLTAQIKPSNENESKRVLSKGDGGDVEQTNKASSDADAFNLNETDQTASQTQRGSHCCGIGIQAIGQKAESDQGAIALAATFQVFKQPCVCGKKGSVGNSSSPTRVSSPGDDGDVEQTNKASSDADAENVNETTQDALEIQAAPCLCKEPGIQAIGQLDKSNQFAAAVALTLQLHPKNAWAPDREKSPGHSGDHKKMGQKVAMDDVGNWMNKHQSHRKVER